MARGFLKIVARLLQGGFTMRICLAVLLAVVFCTASRRALAADAPSGKTAPQGHAAYLTAAEGGVPFTLQGEYLGLMGTRLVLGAQVIAGRDDTFAAVLFERGLPGGHWFKTKVPLQGKRVGEKVVLTGKDLSAVLEPGVLRGTADGATFELFKIHRQSPTLGLRPTEGAIILFDGKNTAEWEPGTKTAEGWLEVGARTRRKFSSYFLHIEFRTPFMPTGLGQGRGNSGVYLNDQYECQILDSFGLAGENNECGGFYKIFKPRVNMCLPPLTWQTYDIDFRQARFDAAGKKSAPAVVTVRHNGVIIHNQAPLPHNTPGGGLSDESQPGSLFLQNHGNPVHFRNIWLVERK